MRRAKSLLVLSLLLSAPALEARAQPARAQDQGQSADDLFEKGKMLYQNGKTKEAHDALAAAWALKKSYDIAANLATTEIELNMFRDAAEHFAYCIQTFPSSGPKKNLAQVKKAFDEVRAKIGALSVKVSVDGAEVFVDGKSAGRAPLREEVFVEPGARTVEAKLPGYEAAKQTVQVSKGPSVPVTLSLVASAQSSAAGASTAPSKELPPLPPEKPKPMLIGLGFGVVGALAVTGVGFALASHSKDTDRVGLIADLGGTSACWPGGNPPAEQCQRVKDLGHAELNFRGLAIASFAVGGAVLGATLAYALWPRRPQERPTVRVLPQPSTHGAGLSVVGAF